MNKIAIEADKLEKELKELDALKSEELKKAEKELFKTVYEWGRIGIVVDEKCNTFQILLKAYLKALGKEKNGKN